MALQAFTVSEPLTLGVELELQLVSTHDFDLAPQAEDLLRVLKKQSGWGREAGDHAQSMIEIGTSIQRQHAVLLAELRDLRDQLKSAAHTKLNIGIAGGGARLPALEQQKIFPAALPLHQRAVRLPAKLAVHRLRPGMHRGLRKTATARSGCCALSRYVPHFIARRPPRPMQMDTSFDSARLNSVFALPAVGPRPSA